LTFQITILGSGSATPTLHANPSAQLLEIGSDYYLIDCGEGTQYRLLERHFRPGRLKGIFISHLHGDHYFGLFGLLTSLSLGQRTEELHLVAPPGLRDVLVEIFRQSDTRLSYPLHFRETDASHPGLIFETPHMTVSTLPLQHRIPCTGFLFREKPGDRKLIKEKITPEMQYEDFRALKQGEDIRGEDGAIRFSSEDYTLPPPPPRSYAYCSDTNFQPDLIPFLEGTDCMYHEATFRDEQLERAKKTFHSTARQAASIARDAGVGKLLIGHLSSRYHDHLISLDEARSVFAETYFAEEGNTYEIPCR
jgi:ribonuclease Z